MDTVEVQKQRVASGRIDVAPGEPSEVTQRRQYTRTRVAPSGRHRAIEAIWLVAGILDVILAFDFLFRALRGANTGFANFIYNLGSGLAAPFDGIFGNTINNTGNGTIGIDRWGDLMAMAIYTLVALALVQVVRISTSSRNSISEDSTTVV
jgi:hypothetical protein